MRLILATRRSPLALAQTELVAAALRAAGHETELLPLVTTGDRWSASGGGETPDKGLFVKELEEALLDGRADLAVHSAKDLPGAPPADLVIAAVPPREDARDVLVGPPGGLDALREGARVATGSPRRAVQLRAARPDVEIVEIRGNVGTRLEKLGRGDADALVLAAAGLRRLGLWPGGTVPLDPGLSTPAPGQGLLAVQARAGGEAAEAAATALDDPTAHACLRAERAVLTGLGGGCREPIGAFCEPVTAAGLRLLAFAAAEGGVRAARVTREGPADDPDALGAEVAAILASVRG
ncbi:MAG: hydroxymethylbilane synthase [Thermoleophilia bacterium]